MWKVTLKGIWAKKLRFVATALAIILGVGFMAGTYMLTDTMKRTFDDLFANAFARASIVVQPKEEVEGGFSARPQRLPADTFAKVRAVDGVRSAEGYVAGYFQLVKPNGAYLGGEGGPNPEGFGWVADPALNAYQIFAGRPPEKDDEIVIDRNSAKLGPFRIGDRITGLTQGPSATYTIVGITTFGQADSAGGVSVSGLTPAAAQRLFQTEGRFDQVLADADPGVSDQTLKQRVAAVIGDDPRLEVLTGQELATLRANEIKTRLSTFTKALVGFSLVSLFVGGFIISNTFSILVAQRTRELALLRAIGAGRRQVVGSVLLEALALGVVGSAIGLGVGVLTAIGLKALFSAFGFNLPASGLVLLPRTIVISFLVGVGITVLSAVFPSRRASGVPPLAAMRDVAIDRSAGSRARVWFGVGFAVAAVGIGLAGLQGKGDVQRVGIGGLFLLLAAIVLGPLIAQRGGRVVGSALPPLKGAVGRLARDNAVRNPRRTSATALALAIGVTIIAFIQVFVASFTGLLTKTVDDLFLADYIITNTNFIGFSPEVGRQIGRLDGVDAVAAVRFGRAKLVDEDAFVAAFDISTVSRVVDLPIVAGSVSDIGRGDIALGADMARENGWKIGDAVPITFPKTGPTTLRLAALVDIGKLRALTRGADGVISIETYDDGYTESVDFALNVKVRDGTDLDALTATMKTTLKDYPTAKLFDPVQYKRSVEGQLNQFVTIIYLLLGLSIVIATFGIANTLMLSIYERTREIGLLRAIGMHRRQVRSAIRWESVIMAVLGAVLGTLLGVAFGSAVMLSLRSEGFSQLVVPWGTLGAIAVVAAAFGVVAAIRPSRKAAGLKILDAIGVE